MKSLLFLAGTFLLAVSMSSKAFAYEFQTLNPKPQGSYLLAQAESGDDAYDPFADYSEFDENSDEEADINFFRNGRFFTVGLNLGMRGFTQELGKLYSSGPTYGLFLSYFFDLRLALQLGFLTGDHDFKMTGATQTDSLSGNVSMTFIDLDLKYYFNTQNVTRGLADLNPYIIGGISQVYRSYTLDGSDGMAKDATTGLNAGVGLEIPIMRRSAFFGVQGVYRYFKFKDADTQIPVPSGNPTGIYPRGNSFDFTAILGLSF